MMDPHILVFLITLLPWLELRASIPIGILIFGLNPFVVFTIALVANMIFYFPIIIGLDRGYSYLMKYPFAKDIIDRIRGKGEGIRGKNKYIALMLFVAVPLPVTGAWTGTGIAWLLHMDRKKAFIAIAGGVSIAAVLVTAISLIAGEVIFNWLGISKF